MFSIDEYIAKTHTMREELFEEFEDNHEQGDRSTIENVSRDYGMSSSRLQSMTKFAPEYLGTCKALE